VIQILILAEQTLDSECYSFGGHISVGAMISLGSRTLLRKARFTATGITRIPAALTATHHPRGQIFWRRFPSAFSSSAMPERHRHHDSIEWRKLFTIMLESCSRSGGIRVRDEVKP